MALIYGDVIPDVTSGMRIGLFGGSFNPPHEGHRLVARTAIEKLGLSQLWWMVSPGNPLKDNKDLPNIERRIALSSDLLAQDGKIAITSFERIIASKNSFQTIEYLLGQELKAHYVWVMGADSLENFHLWYNWQQIAQNLPIFIVNRPGYGNAGHLCVFAKQYSGYKVGEQYFADLADMEPPRWGFYERELSHLSSTALRESNKRESKISNERI